VTLPPFQAFVDRHSAEVMRFLVAMVGPADAEDCFQETFLAALRAYPRVRDPQALRAWILAIARQKALDHHRAGRRRPVPTEDAGADAVAAEPADADPEVWAAVRELPPKQRAALVLRFVVDLPHRDVARALDCSEEAARRSTHEGLTKLREVLA
jgi:RNA polymerase sigma factor (sigma-70 family)